MNDIDVHPFRCGCERCEWRRTRRLIKDMNWFYFRRAAQEAVEKERQRAS